MYLYQPYIYTNQYQKICSLYGCLVNLESKQGNCIVVVSPGNHSHWGPMDQSSYFCARVLCPLNCEYSLEGLMLKLKLPILWPLDVKNWLIGKDPDTGKNWGQEEKGATEGEMVGWHHWLNGDEFEETQGDSDGPRSLACCSSQGRKESNRI